MNTKSRIAAVLNASDLEEQITGIPPFHLSQLALNETVDFDLPTNLRLGHLVEKIVAELIRSSTNYKICHENIQIIADKKTIGELDFIIQNKLTKKLIHLELAYKFYLFDPFISNDPIQNWIGPNRNDSLLEKLNKLKTKQFPLLYHERSAETLNDLNIKNVSQALCLLAALYIPYDFKAKLSPTYEKAVKGYYVTFSEFIALNNAQKQYYLPLKKEWGMDPSSNEVWAGFEALKCSIETCMEEKQAPLCWQKHKGVYTTLFIVWW